MNHNPESTSDNLLNLLRQSLFHKHQHRPTAWKTGLLLLTSSTPTMTPAVDESDCGPPDELSSVAVTFRKYSRPWSFGRGSERRRINPGKKNLVKLWVREKSCSFPPPLHSSLNGTWRLPRPRLLTDVRLVIALKLSDCCVFTAPTAEGWKQQKPRSEKWFCCLNLPKKQQQQQQQLFHTGDLRRYANLAS